MPLYALVPSVQVMQVLYVEYVIEISHLHVYADYIFKLMNYVVII